MWMGSTNSVRSRSEADAAVRRPRVDAWLIAPANTLSRPERIGAVLVCTLLTVSWSALLSGYSALASNLPDVRYYVDTAYGRYGQVVAPFSSRPMAPLLARWLAGLTHFPIEQGFVTLGYVSLAWTAAVVFWIISNSAAPRWFLVAVVAVPFWPELRIFSGLPDPLYAAFLATLLLALDYDWTLLAATLMLPLMLARESTWLTLLCLLVVCWGRLRWTGRSLAFAGAAIGTLIVRRYVTMGLPNAENLSGGKYMAGKLVWNSFRSFGLQPWSDVYPVLCPDPAWQARLHLGPVHSVGVCSWDSVAPFQILWSLLTPFGVLPLLLIAYRRKFKEAIISSSHSMLLRFCLLYGGISLLLAPALGTWFVRLFGYGWPCLLVAVPLLAGTRGGAADSRTATSHWTLGWWGCLLVVHLVICGLGNRFPTTQMLLATLCLQAVAGALLLVQPRRPEGALGTAGPAHPAW